MKISSTRTRLIIITIGIAFLFANPTFAFHLSPFYSRIQSGITILQKSHQEKNSIYIQESSGLVLAEFSTQSKTPYSVIFGATLQKELKDPNQKLINVLVVFDPNISSINQQRLLDSTGLDFTLKKDYQNLPIALIEVSPQNMLQSIKDLTYTVGIKALFLDSMQEADYLTTPSSATLKDDENWWLDAIGATGLPYNGSGIRIAILDTGIYSEHADFASKTPQVTQINFATDETLRNISDYSDIYGHGTHVAGIAAGTGASSSGKYRGVAPGASLANIKTLNNYGGILDSDLLDAIDWIITQDSADIISMSFRTEAQGTVYNPVSVALETAAEHGIVSVAAAGNYGPLSFTSTLPGTAPSVISVGAIDRDLEVTSFSSIGPSLQRNVIPDVLAPGQDIIAPESMDSLLGRGERYTDGTIPGISPNSDYIALSGTSMSTPMVAGAIALLLDAYPELTPEGVRAALYHGAYLPETYSNRYGANGIGAGIINVSASIAWLNSLSNPYSIIQAFPDILPFEPFDLLSYPGDVQEFNISVFSAINSSIAINFTIPSSQNLLITPDSTTLSFTNHSVQFVQIKIKILENATTGWETSSIYLNDSLTGDSLEQIDFSINIRYPRGRVYFDSLHGMNDLYPEWSSGYSQIDIYSAMKVLHENGYQLVYAMDNWTRPGYSEPLSPLLTPNLLSTVDIVVLQTPVVGYTPLEMDALERFRQQGGSILILGTRSQTLAINSLNSLLSRLGTEISIYKENIFDYTDVGFGYVLDRYSVSEIDESSSIFETGDQFSYWYGPILGVQGESQSIAELQGKTVVAVNAPVTGGKVVVWSDYHWLRNDIFNVTNAEDHNRILLNLFRYLNTQEDQDYVIQANFNETIQYTGTLALELSVINRLTEQPINDRIYGTSLNASIISPLGTMSPLNLISLGNGIYSNNSFNLGTTDFRPYIIQINVSSPSGIITKEYFLYSISLMDAVEIAYPTITNPWITRSPGSYTIIQYNGNVPGLNATLYGSFSTDSFYSSTELEEYSADMIPSGIHYTNTYTLTGNEPSGVIPFFAVAFSPNNYSNFEVSRSFLVIENSLPEINENASFFNNIQFSETRTENSMFILRVNDIGTIDLTVKAEETIDYESSTSELYTIVYYTSATSAGSTFDPIYPNMIPTSLLSYSHESDSFEGTFKIPKKLSFTGSYGTVEVSQQSENPDNIIYFSILWITARDPDGGTVDYLILMYVDILFSWDNFLHYLPLIIVILAIIAIIVTITLITKKKFRSPSQASSTLGMNDQNEDGYCIYCGKKINTNWKVCPYCGKRLP